MGLPADTPLVQAISAERATQQQPDKGATPLDMARWEPASLSLPHAAFAHAHTSIGVAFVVVFLTSGLGC